jgi:hypothetical protein
MEDSGIREMVPPTADIKTLHHELEQLFAGTQSSKGETRDKKDDTPGGTCMVIKGK